jgi:hypothetical protein
MGLSALKNQLHSQGMIENNICLPHTNQPKLLSNCPRFAAQKTILFQEMGQIYPVLMNQVPYHLKKIDHLLVNNLIHSDTELENDSNITLVAVTLIFIDNSKRLFMIHHST